MNYFTMLIKPASSLCNMRCKYCFYHDVAEHRKIKSNGIMTESTIDILLKRVFDDIKKPSIINFAFQGGEPTLAGLEYYDYFTKKVEENNTDGHTIHYSIQTNGYLVDDKFCELFKAYNFLVGISLDGPREINDCNRVDINLKGTYDRVNQVIKLFHKYKVEYNVLSVITKQMAKKPQTLFNYYVKSNIKYVQLIPCLKSLDHKEGEALNKYDLRPQEYALFLKELFSLWYEAYKNNQYISIRQFDNLILMLNGQPPEQCGLSGKCNLQCVVEADGSVYPCDFYVLDPYNQGNLHQNSLEDMINSAGARAFLDDQVRESPLCKSCKVYHLCGGGCKRYKSFYSEEKGYCPNQDFLYHAYHKMLEIARQL